MLGIWKCQKDQNSIIRTTVLQMSTNVGYTIPQTGHRRSHFWYMLNEIPLYSYVLTIRYILNFLLLNSKLFMCTYITWKFQIRSENHINEKSVQGLVKLFWSNWWNRLSSVMHASKNYGSMNILQMQTVPLICRSDTSNEVLATD